MLSVETLGSIIRELAESLGLEVVDVKASRASVSDFMGLPSYHQFETHELVERGGVWQLPEEEV